MERTLAELEGLVRNRICNVCTERTVNGTCGLDEPSTCALFSLFPQVAAAIQNTDSPNIEDYIAAIRKNVCSVCAGQDAAGDCGLRQEVQCALDAYLIFVVEAIEEATGKDFGRPIPERPKTGPIHLQF